LECPLRSLLNHKLCRPEVLLQIEDLVEVQVLDLELVAVVVEPADLDLLHNQQA
jgi:hypothetical protein